MSDRRFGFRQIPDVRDHLFTMPPLLATSPEDRREVVHWEQGKIRDQGREGQCVGYGCKALLESSPFRQADGPTATEIYLEARLIDEFPDDSLNEGTSVRAGLNVLKNHGLIKNYVWATSLEDVYQFIAKYGPVVLGVSWHGYETDANGLMSFDGPIVGYHCILAVSVNRVTDEIGFQNSWGPSFGMSGMGKMRGKDLSRELHKRSGVAAGVVERLRQA